MIFFEKKRTSQSVREIVFIALSLPALLLTGTASASTHGPNEGTAIYTRTCLACHGSDGAGTMPGIPDLTEKNGPMSKSDEVLLESILKGIETESAPTPMPPMGGEEEMTRSSARSVLEYIRREFGK